MGPRGVALESQPPTKRCPLLRLHRQKGLQKRKGTCALTKNHHLHPKPQPPELHNTTSDCENLAQRPSKEGGHTDLADPQPGPFDWYLASTDGDPPHMQHPRGAGGTSAIATLSKGCSGKPGWPLSKLAWPPGKPLEPPALTKIRTFKLELSLLLELNGCT